MNITFNRGTRNIKSLELPNSNISITNTPMEIQVFCSGNTHLTKCDGGNIISHDTPYMFYKDTNLSSITTRFRGVVYAPGMFQDCIGLKSISTDFANLKDGSGTNSFQGEEFGYGMFKNCVKLETAKISGLSNLYNGNMMFCNCKSLTSFSADTESLVLGSAMFFNCEKLQDIHLGDLSSLEQGKSMFANSGIKSFSANTTSLAEAKFMFAGCSSLTDVSFVLSQVSGDASLAGTFDGCTALRRLSVGELKTNLNISDSPLTLSSISGIATNAIPGSHTISISDYTKNLSGFNKVKEIFTLKGWKVL